MKREREEEDERERRGEKETRRQLADEFAAPAGVAMANVGYFTCYI
jgi:hypothetical protein